MKVQVVRKVLEVNDRLADEIRETTASRNTVVINVMSSPGSGKTSLLERLIPRLLANDVKIGVIEGDITTTRDADRLAQLNIPISQINTDVFGGDCHLGSEAIRPALDHFDLKKMDLIFIENVGNLVCPAEFDTGANFNAVVISTTEGEDKPLKYPLMFRTCQLALINKIDLLPYLEFDVEQLEQNIHTINPDIDIFQVSARTDEGLDVLAVRLLRMLS